MKIDDDSSCIPTHTASRTTSRSTSRLTSRTTPPNNSEQNQFCMENIDVSNFLNLHSLGNHEDFCLAYVFTYR